MLEHNCVVVPGLGGFIGNYAHAYIDPVHHTFHPPSKKLLFNVSLSRNDGLLANRLSENTEVSFVAACRLLDQFSDECRESLRRGHPVVFPSIGRLMPGPEGTILLEQDLNINLLPGSFGLNHFMAPPVIRKATPSGLAITESHPAGNHPRVMPQLLRWAAFFALPAATVAIMGITGFDTISSKLSNAGLLSPFMDAFNTLSVGSPGPSVVTKNPDIKRNPPVQPATEKPVTPPTEAIQSSVSTETLSVKGSLSSDDRFAVIVGAFRMRENAERYIGELKAEGHDAMLYDVSATGLHRVTIGTSRDRNIALQLLANARSDDFNGAWLLSK